MVNAGPFLLVRLSPLVVLSPVAMAVIAIIGAATALFAAVVSLTQTDIKKLLAYSTISQIGFMIMTCGLGAFVVAIFHLLAHGFFKGFLFLSTGNALQSVQVHRHPASDSGHAFQPTGVLFIGALMLACIPPFVIFSGPYEYLWTVQNFASAKLAFWVIGLTTVFCTGMYLFRGISLLFQQGLAGEIPGPADSGVIRPQLFSPSHLIGVVVGAAAMGSVLVLLWTWFAQCLAPALAQPVPSLAESSITTGLSLWIGLPLVVAVGGWGFAYWLHMNPRWASLGDSAWGKTLYVLFLNKLYVDEIYEVYVVQPTLRLADWLWKTVDLGGIDRAITTLAEVSIALARWLWQVIDIRGIEQNIERLGYQADAAGHMLLKVEPRTLQHYLLVMVFWLIGAIGLFYWFAA